MHLYLIDRTYLSFYQSFFAALFLKHQVIGLLACLFFVHSHLWDGFHENDYN